MENKRTLSLFFWSKRASLTIIAITSLNMVNGQTRNPKISDPDTYTIIVNSPKIEKLEEVIINGSVKDEIGAPLPNTKIASAFGEEYFTDNNGNFSFKLTKEQVAVQSIFFTHGGLVTEVRSYDPVMANAVYDIILRKPFMCCRTIPCDEAMLKSSTLYFTDDKNTISKEIKKQLDTIAASLKECPTSKILMVGNSKQRKSSQKLTDMRLNTIKSYLIEHNGISSDRIKTQIITDKTNSNNIDIKPE